MSKFLEKVDLKICLIVAFLNPSLAFNSPFNFKMALAAFVFQFFVCCLISAVLPETMNKKSWLFYVLFYFGSWIAGGILYFLLLFYIMPAVLRAKG